MRRCAILVGIALVCATAGFAYQPDYFPLNPGNRWVYTQEGAVAGAPIVLEVVQGDVIDGRWYALVRGFPSGAAWLRLGEEGTLYAYDAETKTDKVWLAFDAGEGSAFSTEITPCNKEARIEARNAEWKGVIGEFNNALKITYAPGACADAGLSADVFLPYVGLVERTEITIAGPRTYRLIYANLGGVTFVSAPEMSFTLTLDKYAYASRTEARVMTARITLRNTRLDPFKLTFPSGQFYDLVIKDASGNIVYRWSDGKAFPLVVAEMEVGPGELNYVVQTPLADSAGNPLPPGTYTAEGFLTNTPPERFAATVSFEIQPAP